MEEVWWLVTQLTGSGLCAASELCRSWVKMVKDLLNPLPADEKRKHKLKRLVQSPNSFFMDVKCPGCFTITTVFSHAQVRGAHVAGSSLPPGGSF